MTGAPSARWPMRLRIFLFGIGSSLAILGCFVARVILGTTLAKGTIRRPDQIDQILTWLFVCLNPLLAFVGRLSLVLPATFRGSSLGITLIAVCDLTAFLAGWWLVASLVVWLARRRARVAI
jgi:hypothetical protein